MTTPKVRPVRIRLDGDDNAAVTLAELIAAHLPALTGGRVQIGDLSPAYTNRRGPGHRRYLEAYVLDDQDSDREAPR